MTLSKHRKRKKPSKPIEPVEQTYFQKYYEIGDHIDACSYGEIQTLRVKKDNALVVGKFVHSVVDPKEFRIHVNLNHPNVLRAFEWCHYDKPVLSFTLSYKVLVMEYADGGTLYRLMHEREFKFEPLEIRALVSQLTDGLAYIHERGYIHRDIKPANILMVNGVPKIADFGIAVSVSLGKRKQFSGILGTAPYRAPEMLCSFKYNHKYDVWSLGVVISEIVARQNVFQIESRGNPSKANPEDMAIYCLRQILDKTGVPTEDEFPCLRSSIIFMYANFPPLNPEKPYFLEPLREKLGDDGCDFLAKCLTVAPKLRWTSKQLLEHPYLACCY